MLWAPSVTDWYIYMYIKLCIFSPQFFLNLPRVSMRLLVALGMGVVGVGMDAVGVVMGVW